MRHIRGLCPTLLLLVSAVSCATFINSYAMNSLVSQGKSDSGLFIGMGYDEVLKTLGAPDRKLNYQGAGYFHYRTVGIHFTDIIGYYENDKFIETNNGKSIAMISWHSSATVFGITMNRATKDEVHSTLGNPTSSRNIDQNGDGESFIIGDVDIYRSGKYCFLIRYNESHIAVESMLLPSTYFFHGD